MGAELLGEMRKSEMLDEDDERMLVVALKTLLEPHARAYARESKEDTENAEG